MAQNKIDTLTLKKMFIAGANKLLENKQLIDSLNVFPVPDGDTGTNMSLTITSAAREVIKNKTAKVDDLMNSAASGSLRGARGNSGVILSQLIRGFSKGLDSTGEADVKALAIASKNAVKTAYKAVMKPKEGTILTVARVCAECSVHLAKDPKYSEDIEAYLTEIITEGHKILAQTKEMLPVLKQADVVDAGGMGLMFILEGALHGLTSDEEIVFNEDVNTAPAPAPVAENNFSALSTVETADIKFGYCTEFFINLEKGNDRLVPEFKTFLNTLGDSIVVVNDETFVKVHVHTNHPGRVLERALEMGTLTGMKIDNMREQHTNKIDFGAEGAAAKADATPAPQNSEPKETAFISVLTGSGLAEVFTNLGADKLIEGGQTMNPSTEDILNAIQEVNAKNVIVLPNNSNIILAAQQAANLTEDKNVFVVPTKTIPEGIGALLNYSADDDIESNIENITEAISSIKTGLVTYAIRDTVFGDKEIKSGNILCMLDGEIVIVDESVEEGTKKLLDMAITDDNDIVSIYYGEDVNEEDAQKILEYAEENFEDCEFELLSGKQPLYYYIISIE